MDEIDIIFDTDLALFVFLSDFFCGSVFYKIFHGIIKQEEEVIDNSLAMENIYAVKRVD